MLAIFDRITSSNKLKFSRRRFFQAYAPFLSRLRRQDVTLRVPLRENHQLRKQAA